MKNILNYEDWLILERNKTVEYFRNNPQALSSHSSGVTPHKEDWKPELDDSIENKREEATKAKFLKRLRSLEGIDTPFDVDSKTIWSIGEILVGRKEGYSSWYDWHYFLKAFMEAKNIDQFIEANSARKRMFRFPTEDYSNQKDISQYGKFYSFIKKNWDILQKSFNWLQTALQGIKGSAKKGYENDLMALGLSTRDVEVAMSHIKNWTSMSRKKLDPSVFNLLQKISVSDNLLPKYVYRGIFYDGAKIKDLDKWSKKWYPGAKPGASQGKATSWSVDRGTAISFMNDQDFIKDRDNGYYMLLKWKVDPKLVICDLRNLPVDHTFWNQQEIIVSPEATDYEIDTMIPGKEGYEVYKKFCEENPGGQGAWGSTKAMTAARFLLMPYDDFSPGDRMEMKRVAKMTVSEFLKEYPGAKINTSPEFQNVAMPIWNYIDRHFWRVTVVSSTREEVKFRLEYTMDDLGYSSVGPELKAVVDKFKSENYNQFYGKDAIISNEGTVKLLNDDYYNIDIEVNWPTEFSIVKNGRHNADKGEPRAEDIKTDTVLQKVFDEVGGSKFFAQWSKTKQAEKGSQLSRNVNIQLK